MNIPSPRGPISAQLDVRLRTGGRASLPLAELGAVIDGIAEPLVDDDLNLALASCYELHYRGFDDVDADLEWDPELLALRALLETAFERGLVATVGPPMGAARSESIAVVLRHRLDAASHDSSPSLSSYMLREATREEYRDLLKQRSVYHLKEADPHTWGIPRIGGAAKAALVEIQTDEYGAGSVARMHATLFAGTMRALGLDNTYGAYWDVATAETLATVNVMSFFGLHRRLRGALLGHLAALEMDSTVPNRRYANGLRRLGLGREATAYFDEHVEADAVHEQIAAHDMCGSFVRDEPDQAAMVLWGADCLLALDAAAARRMLSSWGSSTAARTVA